MGRLSKTGVAVGAAALLAAGSGVFALASSNVGTITVCVSHQNGTLYQASRCAKRDKTLTWNRQGPQGVPGTARAYAWVRGTRTPSLDPSRTKGFTSVTRRDGLGGRYCLTLSSKIVATHVAPVVSVAYDSGIVPDAEFAYPVDRSQAGTLACKGNAIEVFTEIADPGQPSRGYPWLDFTVMVP